MMGKRKHERSKSMRHRERSSSSSSCERDHKKYKKSKMKKRHRSCSWDKSQSVVMARRGRKQRSDSISDSSSDTSSDSPSSSNSSEDCKHKTTKKKRKSADKKKKRKKKKKKHKYHKKKDDKLLKPETASQLNVGPATDPKKGQKTSSNTLDAQRRMAPMTKDEWERQQSVTRRVFDPDTGRTRLVRGSGEIVEEIVSKECQKEINKQATIGDGLSYQRAAGLL